MKAQTVKSMYKGARVADVDELNKELKVLASLGDEKLGKLADALLGIHPTKVLTSDDMKKVAKVADIAESVMIDLFPAMLTVYLFAKETKVSYEDALRTIPGSHLDSGEIQQIGTFFSKADPALLPAWEDFDRSVIPTTPVPQFSRMRTRILNIVEYEEEFGGGDEVEKYAPAVSHLHSRALFTVSTDDEDKSLSFLASEDDIDYMIKWLRLSRNQLKALTDRK